MSVNFLSFVNASDFPSNAYNYNILFQALMADVGAANSGLGTFIQGSSSNSTNGQSVYVQTCGNPTTYYIDIRDSGNLSIVFNSLCAFSNIGCPCNPNTTYKITYYNPSSNCPWYNSSSTSSCYMMQALTSNSIPLNSNISVYAISTRNTSLTAYLTIPSLSFGSNFYIKDFSNVMSMSQIRLQCNNGNVFSTGNTTMNTNNQSVHICGAGNGTNGTLLQLN